MWFYWQQDFNGFYIVGFSSEKVDFVICDDGTSTNLPYFEGVRGGADLGEIVSKFGTPSLTVSSKDELTRRISYASLSTTFELKRNRVTALGIFEGQGVRGLDFDRKVQLDAASPVTYEK